MSIITKIFAIVMFPLSILIILKSTGILLLNLPFDIMFIGAILMIALQLSNLILVKIKNNTVGFMGVLTSILFILPALTYFFIELEYIPLILGVLMFAEAIYALH